MFGVWGHRSVLTGLTVLAVLLLLFLSVGGDTRRHWVVPRPPETRQMRNHWLLGCHSVPISNQKHIQWLPRERWRVLLWKISHFMLDITRQKKNLKWSSLCTAHSLSYSASDSKRGLTSLWTPVYWPIIFEIVSWDSFHWFDRWEGLSHCTYVVLMLKYLIFTFSQHIFKSIMHLPVGRDSKHWWLLCTLIMIRSSIWIGLITLSA